MAHTIGKVRVKDFDQFLSTFETRGKEKRGEHGSRGATVFRNSDDPNEAIIVFDWDKGSAQEFLEDPEAKEIMQAAGLEGPPQLTFVEQVADIEA